MNILADIAIKYLTAFMFTKAHIDAEFAATHTLRFPELVASLSAEERSALSAAAKRALDFSLQSLDKDGRTTPPSIGDEENWFLSSIASGDLYDHWRLR
jgi:hypothetical protein